MKIKINSSPKLARMSKSVVRSFIRLVKPSVLALVIPCLLGSGALSIVRAEDQDPLGVIRKLSATDVKSPQYAEEVARLVKAFPKKAEEIIAEAVKNKPACARECVKAGILALQLDGNPDPKLAASVVWTVLQYVQTTDPDFIERTRQGALDADPGAAAEIDATIGKFLAGIEKTGSETAEQDNPTRSQINPTPTPNPTPKPVTPFQNQ